MEFRAFHQFKVARLTVEYIYGLVSSTIDLVQKFIEHLDPASKAVLVSLTSQNETISASVRKLMGSTETKEIVAQDKLRDAEHNAIKRSITFYKQEDDSALVAAAEELETLVRQYWDIDTKARDTQTTLTNDMLMKYNGSESCKTAATTISVAHRFTNLETINNVFKGLFSTRRENKASSNVPSATSLRPALEKEYVTLCQCIEVATNYLPSDQLTLLFNEMDDLRKKYSILINNDSDEDTDPNIEGDEE